jgi:hypothetical protein
MLRLKLNFLYFCSKRCFIGLLEAVRGERKEEGKFGYKS